MVQFKLNKYFFVNNLLDRCSISARQNLKADPDGSTGLHIQKDFPGPDKESNWLPAPAGKFILMLRMYWPNENSPSILDGSWTIPPVERASTPKYPTLLAGRSDHFENVW